MMVVYRRKSAFLSSTSSAYGWVATSYQSLRTIFTACTKRIPAKASRSFGVTRVCVGGIVRWQVLWHLLWINRLKRQVPGTPQAIQLFKGCKEGNLGAVCIGDLFAIKLANSGCIPGCK